MKVVKIDSAKAVESTSQFFAGGKVSMQKLVDEKDAAEFKVGVVNFSPGAVNKPHTHTAVQVLFVTQGKGIVATEDQEVTVTPGTLIIIGAGEKHWHGATKDSAFSHLAIMSPGETKFQV